MQKKLNRDEVIAEHERLVACWSDRCGRPDWGANHTARAEALRNGAELTETEIGGNDLAIMHETLARSAISDDPSSAREKLEAAARAQAQADLK